MADLRIEESPGHVLAPAVSEAEERVSLASNRQLIWWRFRKHRLAMVSGAMLIVFYLVVLFPHFFAIQDPEATDARLAFIPLQHLTVLDGWGFRPSRPAAAGTRTPQRVPME